MRITGIRTNIPLTIRHRYEAILPTVRRYLILFLVFLLPLQISWAAVANYCSHEKHTAASHFGHHQDEHQHAASSLDNTDDDKQPTDKYTFGHDHNHLSGFIALLLTETPIADHIPSSQLLPDDISVLPLLPPDRLERPNWFALA
jgi:hypothetical protein